MNTKAPPPCPPPRPDLETDSPMPKLSRAAPPPIPLRPDLGEGVDEIADTIPKIPPSTLPKKPSIKKKQGRPEISIISAKPISFSGAFVPFVPEPLKAAPQIVPPFEPCNTINDSPLVNKPYQTPIPGQASVDFRPSSFDVTPVQSEASLDIIKPAFSLAAISSTALAPALEPSPITVGPTQPAKADTSSYIAAPIFSDYMVPSSMSATKPAKPVPTPTIQPTKQAPQIQFNETSPPKVIKSTKPREPPQRPKSKPVCEPSLANDPFQVGFQNNMAAERLAEPIAPKRAKDKPKKLLQESRAKDFGVNNTAFQELDANQIDSMLMVDDVVEVKKENEVAPSKKEKLFPTVIRTKPNGKENPKSDVSPSYRDDLVQFEGTQVKYTKPTIIKTQTRNKPPPPPSQNTPKTAQDSSTGSSKQVSSTPTLETQPQQGKMKTKPTIIIPKTKRDEGKKKELITSPPERIMEVESKDNSLEDKTSKAKKMPNIIRPNRQKKDKNKADNEPPNFRGMPEGQSHEGSQAKPKIVPVRKAPPRPSPPKPGPPRPGPPKKVTNEHPAPQTRTQPAGTVTTEGTYTEHNGGDKGRLRPATIGKEKGAEKKQIKNIETTVVSSVVETKIEPSCIALYDFAATNIDELSFEAGDEIFLVQRINQDWYIGRLGDCEGMIPVKFVEIIEDLPAETEKHQTKVSLQNESSLSASVLYDFPGQSQDELTLYAGDTVLLLELINDDWLKGSCNGMSGMFPSNFVNFTQEMKEKLLLQKQNNKTDNSVVVSSGPRCKALYDYHTENDGDLTFNKNDIIKLTERINADWLMGELNGVIGMFPAEYVDILEHLVSSSSTGSSSSKVLGSSCSSYPIAKALYDYISDTDGDLSFRKGDMVTIINKISEEWLEGELDGKKGIFPAAFVESVPVRCSPKIDNSKLQQGHLLPKARALYDFTGESDQELSFKTGDEILLLQNINSDWMEGELNNCIGEFPTAFVEVLVPLP